MIAMVLIGLAAGCASALMFASIISGALISLLLFYLAPLPLMVAAIGWGPLCGAIGGIAASLGLGAIFGFITASPLRSPSRCPAGGSAISCCSADRCGSAVRQWRGTRRARPRMVSGRPHPALDRGLCGADHLCRAAHARHRCRRRSRHPAAGCTRIFESGGQTGAGRSQQMGRCDGDDLPVAAARSPSDADVQPLARRKDHGHVGPAAPAMAGFENRGAAPRRSPRSASQPPDGGGWTAVDPRGDRHLGPDDGLRVRRLCRAAYADAGVEEPRACGSARPTRSSCCSSGR